MSTQYHITLVDLHRACRSALLYRYAQVQARVDELLRGCSLARVAFFGQHAGGGLLDKTDAAFKAELSELLPLRTWEGLRENAKQLVATARDSLAAASGELGANERLAIQAAEQEAALRAQVSRCPSRLIK